MDSNASKALLMAGGVLISMMVIGLAVATYSHAQDLARANEESLSASQIESFNRFYTAYRTTYTGPSSIRWVDAVNILNRAVEDEVDVNLTGTAQSIITETAAGFYTADPANYTTVNVNYEISFINGIGIVDEVRIY